MVKPQTLTIGQLVIYNHLPKLIITTEQAEAIAERLKQFNLQPLTRGGEQIILLSISGSERVNDLEECVISRFQIKAQVDRGGSLKFIRARASCLDGLFGCIQSQINKL